MSHKCTLCFACNGSTYLYPNFNQTLSKHYKITIYWKIVISFIFHFPREVLYIIGILELINRTCLFRSAPWCSPVRPYGFGMSEVVRKEDTSEFPKQLRRPVFLVGV